MWLLQKNLPAIVVVFVYAKQIMALGRRKKIPAAHSSHSFHPLIINAKGDGLETASFFFTLTFHAPCLPYPFKSCFLLLRRCGCEVCVSKRFLGLPRGVAHPYLWSHIAVKPRAFSPLLYSLCF